MSTSPYAPRPLEVGKLYRLDGPEGAPWEVVRVTQAAATLKRRGERVQRVFAQPDGTVRSFNAWEGGGFLSVSPFSFVWAGPEREEAGDDAAS